MTLTGNGSQRHHFKWPEKAMSVDRQKSPCAESLNGYPLATHKVEYRITINTGTRTPPLTVGERGCASSGGKRTRDTIAPGQQNNNHQTHTGRPCRCRDIENHTQRSQDTSTDRWTLTASPHNYSLFFFGSSLKCRKRKLSRQTPAIMEKAEA